jgi:membrane-associated phospholipid phosphatase
MVTITWLLVVTGTDWNYFLLTYNEDTRPFLFIADVLGFIVPILLPIGLYIYSWKRNNSQLKHAANVATIAIISGLFASMLIKAFTGRISPPHHGPFDVDMSSAFQFGFMEHHIIGGWPSSHATVMCALATVLYVMFPKKWKFHLLSFFIVFFVSFGVTFGFHWLSECIAGLALGFFVGSTVGHFYNKQNEFV